MKLFALILTCLLLTSCKTDNQPSNTSTTNQESAAGIQGAKGEKGDKGDKGDRGEKGEKGDAGKDANALPDEVVIIMQYQTIVPADFSGVCLDGTLKSCSVLKRIKRADFLGVVSTYVACTFTSFAPGYYYLSCPSSCWFVKDNLCPGPWIHLKEYRCNAVPYTNINNTCEWNLPQAM